MGAFGPYEPDQPDSVTGISRNISGVVPIMDRNFGVAYKPYPALTTATGATALLEKPRGVISLVNKSGIARVFVGQSTKIVEMDATWGPTDIATGLSLPADDDWSFAHFGAFLVATNTTYGMWAYNVDTSSGAGAVGGNSPKARQIVAIGELLYAMDCDDDDKRWENCALGNHTIWPGAGSTLEANGDSLEDGGPLIAGREVASGRALIFQDDTIRILQFGGNSLFTISKFASDVGSVGERSLKHFNGMVFGLHTKGFFATNGVELRWIGNNKVDNAFLDGIVAGNLHLVDGAVDPANKLVHWYYNGKRWIYNWSLGTWSTITESMNSLMRVRSPGYTVDTASALGNVDTIPYGPDSRFWQGGAQNLAAFGTDNKLAFFNGSNVAAELDTAVVNNQNRNLILEATPLTDDSAVTLAIGTSERLQDSISFSSDVALGNEGFCPIDGTGRNIVFRQKHAAAATWTYARGVDHPVGDPGGSL